MEHNEARHKLSEYLDGSITSGERAAIEAHLKICPDCSSALQELRKTVEHIKSVDDVEPPAGMTRKIMARVRAGEEEKKSLFRRFFSPLSVRLPIQAAAVLFLTVTAFYIYRNIHPSPIPSEAPVQKFAVRKEAPSAPARQDKNEEQRITKDALVPAKKAPQAPEYKALDMKQEYEKPAPPAALGKAAASAPAPAAAKPFTAPAMGPTAAGEQRLAGTEPAERAKAAAADEGAESAVDLTMKVKELDSAEKEIAKAVTVSGGRITRTSPPVDRSVIMVSINRDKFAGLLSRLKTIGDVNEKAPAPAGLEGQLTIRITLTINRDND